MDVIKHSSKGDTIFLTGSAGTGKSFILDQAIEWLEKEKKYTTVKLASTGMAANLISGQTFHSFFAVPPRDILYKEKANYVRKATRQLWSNTDVVIIDEISMIRPDMLDYISWIFEQNDIYNTEKLYIFVGDLNQCQPITSVQETRYETPYFYSSELCNNLQTIELKTIVRQKDESFIDALNLLKQGKVPDYFDKFRVKEYNEDFTYLSYRNYKVNEINNQRLDSINSDEIVFSATIQGKAKPKDFPVSETIKVKEGAKIMYLLNKNGLVNGSIGTFRIGKNGKYFIEVDDRMIPLHEEPFEKIKYVSTLYGIQEEIVGYITQYPIKLAWALTVHKSQGQTLDNAVIDLQSIKHDKYLLYTAFSRLTSTKNLQIV